MSVPDWMNEPVDPRTTWERRIEAERQRRIEAEERFEASQAKHNRWRKLKFAGRLCALPFRLTWAFGRIGVELWRARA